MSQYGDLKVQTEEIVNSVEDISLEEALNLQSCGYFDDVDLTEGE